MPILIVALVFIALFWGVFLGPLRRFFVAATGALSRATRAPGSLTCPECAYSLKPGAEHAVSHHECPGCFGKWASHAALTAGLAVKKKPAPEWFEESAGVRLSCASCAATLRAGVLRGQEFLVFRCAPCDAYWFGRTAWTSLELRVL